MNIHDATEQAYKRGYEAGVEEFAARLYAYKTDIFIKGEELMIIPLSDYEMILKELTESKNDLEG